MVGKKAAKPAAAIAKTASKLTHYPMVIAGKKVNRGSQDLIAPATGKAFATVALGTLKDVETAVAAAKEAQRTWGALSPGERSGALLKWADLLEKNADKLASLESLNVANRSSSPSTVTCRWRLTTSVISLASRAGLKGSVRVRTWVEARA